MLVGNPLSVPFSFVVQGQYLSSFCSLWPFRVREHQLRLEYGNQTLCGAALALLGNRVQFICKQGMF